MGWRWSFCLAMQNQDRRTKNQYEAKREDEGEKHEGRRWWWGRWVCLHCKIGDTALKSGSDCGWMCCENGDWFRGEHLCCRQILWSELKQQKIDCVSKKCDKRLYAYGNKEPLNKSWGHFQHWQKQLRMKFKLNLLSLMVKEKHCLEEKLPCD